VAEKENIITAVKKICAELKARGVIKIKSAYLFGSHVSGRAVSGSDIDLAIVSDSFTGFKFRDRQKLNPYLLKFNSDIEIHPYSPDEFRLSFPFVKEIVRKGIRII